jgi:hypothetical protein
MRVRRARHDLLARAHSNPNYQSPADDAMRLKILRQLLRTAPDKPIPDEFRELFGALQGPDKFATILSDLAARLSVMDRYERRCRGANSQFARSMRRGPVKELCQTRDLLMSYFGYQSREHVQGGPPQFCGCTPLDRRVFAQLRTRVIVRYEQAA